MANRNSILVLLLASLLASSTSVLHGQYEIGVVYYATDHGYSSLQKETAPEGGSFNYSVKVKGAHAAIRLLTDQTQGFKVCSVDATRFKLFRFKIDGDSRTLTLVKRGLLWGSKTVLSESEIPLLIEVKELGCFSLSPLKRLEAGEYGFSPVGSTDAFMFGVGAVRQRDSEKPHLSESPLRVGHPGVVN